MSRRIFICFVISVLLLSVGFVTSTTSALAQATTPTPTATTTCIAPTYYATVSSSATSVNTGGQVIVTVRSNVGEGQYWLTIIDNATGVRESQTDPIFGPIGYLAQTPPGGVYVVQFTLTAIRAGSVTFSSTVNGEIVGCTGVFTLGSASGQSGSVTVSGSPITLTPISTLTPTPTVTATGTITKTSTRTRTPTRTPTGPTPTRTRTPTITPLTPTATPTCGCLPPPCSTPLIIAAPFTQDGVGAFCWQSTNLGAYINSWNLASLTVNNVNETNLYVAAGSYPAKINGYWYVNYTSTASYGHFEAK